MNSTRWKIITSAVFITLISIIYAALCYAGTSYTIIGSDLSLEEVIRLQDNFKQVIPEGEGRYLDCQTLFGREIITASGIEAFPLVVFDEGIEETEGFLSLAMRGLLEKKAGYYIIPQNVIRMVSALFLYKREARLNQLELFVMSECIYGKSAAKRLINYIRNNQIEIEFKLRYIVSIDKDGKMQSLHGDEEIKEDIRQLIIQKYWPDKFFDYLMLKNKTSYKEALRETGIKEGDINRRWQDGEDMLNKDAGLVKELGIYASPTILLRNQYLIADLAKLRQYSPFDKETETALTEEDAFAGPVPIQFFYKLNCRHCRKVKDDLFPALKEKFGDNIEIIHHDIDKEEELGYFVELQERYAVLEMDNSIPKVIVQGKVLSGEKEIRQRLESIIEESIASGKSLTGNGKALFSIPLPVPALSDKEKIVDVFKGFSPWAVCAAGFLDGINPCAFTTMVFFICFLTFTGYGKREIIYVGSFFILAIFLTYLLLGLGIFKFIQRMQAYGVVVDIIQNGIIVLALALGIISLLDFWRYKKTGKADSVKLKLPSIISKTIRAIIGDKYRVNPKQDSGYSFKKRNMARLVSIALFSGFVISLLESVCTGQIYLPTISFVTKMPLLRIRALFYLVLYNLMFVVPLIVIFLFGLKGMTSEQFARFVQKHLGKIKLLTAGLFFGLASLLWILR